MVSFQPLSRPADSRPLRDRSAWLLSLLVHLVFLLVISFLTIHVDLRQPAMVLTTQMPEPVELQELRPDQFHFDPTPRENLGASAMGGLDNAARQQMEMPPLPKIPSIEVPPEASQGQIRAREMLESTSNTQTNLNRSVKGAAGVAVTGADGAIERLTQEILLSLEERNTLVVWFFDQSASLQTQREQILDRFHQVYEELGMIQASDPSADEADAPLLTSVVTFGQRVAFPIRRPTNDLRQVTSAVAAIERDDSGIERVFTAVHQAAQRFRKYRHRDRNVMFILFTDEAGDDVEQMDRTVDLCRGLRIPVYVVGVPAPFGRQETLVKWVDPNPKYDQSVQWGRVNQGPESLLMERIKVTVAGIHEDEAPIDSGFGPFALTRLCYETDGIYFTVHPNRRTGRRVRKGETERYTAYFSAFFDPDIMRRYRPDYVSRQEYMQQVKQSRMRQALLQAARRSWLEPLKRPRRRFVVRNEAQFVNELIEAQKQAASLSPNAHALCEILQQGEADRAREIDARWQAGFDLAMGRALATMVRADSYNHMLGRAKGGMKFKNKDHNTWVLKSANEITVSSRLERAAEKAREYLQRVLDQHPGTPWALIAQRELSVPVGWQWTETRTNLDPPRNQVASNNSNDNNPSPPQDDRRREVKPSPPKRPPPRL